MNNEPLFTFRAVQVYVAVIEAKSVTGAAKRLSMSASSVSQQLANLEAALGAKLIERTARQFRVTPAGALFRTRALKLLDDVSAAKSELTLAANAPSLSLRIASVEDFDAAITPAWLCRLGDAYPAIDFSLAVGGSRENHAALADRAMDIVVAADGDTPADWIEHHPLVRDPYILVTKDEKAPVSLDSLATRPFIAYSSEMLIGRQIAAQLQREGTATQARFAVSTNAALFEMIARTGGWGISTALALIGAGGRWDGVSAHPLPMRKFSRNVSLLARRGALGALPELFAIELRRLIASEIAASADITPKPEIIYKSE